MIGSLYISAIVLVWTVSATAEGGESKTTFETSIDGAEKVVMGPRAGKEFQAVAGFDVGPDFLKRMTHDLQTREPRNFKLSLWPMWSMILLDNEDAVIAAYCVSESPGRLAIFPASWKQAADLVIVFPIMKLEAKAVESPELKTLLEDRRLALERRRDAQQGGAR